MNRKDKILVQQCSISNISLFVDNIFAHAKKAYISIVGWQDGNFFFEIGNENGGLDNKSIELFKKLPIYKKRIDNLSSFNEVAKPYLEAKSFKSKNDKYNYLYDVFY